MKGDGPLLSLAGRGLDWKGWKPPAFGETGVHRRGSGARKERKGGAGKGRSPQ